MKDTWRYLLHLSIFVLLVILVGTLGFYFIEGDWSIGDALYMTVISITTVGFSEIHELSPQARYFTIGLIFLGFGVVAIFVTQFAGVVIETEIEGFFGGKKMRALIAKMKNHYIVCGYGRVGQSICEELQRKKVGFAVIEGNEEQAEMARKKGYHILQDNATSDEVLKAAGIEKALGIVAALREDADNLFISLAAREMNRKILIISRSEEPGVEQRILRAGADMIVSPLTLGGKHIAHLVTQNNTGTAPESLNSRMPSIMGLSLRLFRHPCQDEITVGEALNKSKALMATALKRQNGSLVLQPGAEVKVSPLDSLIICVNGNPAETVNAISEATGPDRQAGSDTSAPGNTEKSQCGRGETRI